MPGFNDWLKNNQGLLGVGAIGGSLLAGMLAPDAMKMLGKFDQKYMSPSAYGHRFQGNLGMLMGSPQYAHMMTRLFGQTSRQESGLKQQLARSGVNRSAIGGATKTLLTGGLSSGVGQLNSQMGEMALGMTQSQLQGLMQMYGQMPNYKDMFFGAGLAGLGKMAFPGGKG